MALKDLTPEAPPTTASMIEAASAAKEARERAPVPRSNLEGQTAESLEQYWQKMLRAGEASAASLREEIVGSAAWNSVAAVQRAMERGLGLADAADSARRSRLGQVVATGERPNESRELIKETKALKAANAKLEASLNNPKSFDAMGNPRGKEHGFEMLESGGIVTSFSGQDIEALAFINGNNGKTKIQSFINLQTISVSVFREKQPVRALGYITEKGKTRGTRTIAGSFVFTLFDRDTFFDALRKTTAGRTNSQTDNLVYGLPDQLPKFDLVLTMSNEYGIQSEMALYGIDIISTGQVMSAENLITEQTVQYTAQYMKVMRPGGYKDSYTADSAKKKATGLLGRHLAQRNKIMNENLAF